MGLGDIVALALGGYTFVAKLLLTRDRMVRWDGYEMLFVCGVAAVMLLILTYPMAVFARKLVDCWPEDVGVLTVAGVLGIPVGAVLAFAGNRNGTAEAATIARVGRVELGSDRGPA
ncbi:MAG: hypothetical protein OXJ53_03230 [Gammaproteobacteria bacterium]|nr:hypothetical protein [Gammaproteobacteria bacterium]MDD9961865.1 hypothetical protein [Gammaproteobacteria bacterium]MDE0271426.1 hypothetical protein [Gammaproteobacteria bacterium]